MLLDPGNMRLHGTEQNGEARLEAGLSDKCEGRYAGSRWCTPSLSHFWQHYGGRVHARRLHGHRLALFGFKPLPEPVEILQHGAEGLDLFLYSLRRAAKQTGHEHLLVNINSTTALIDDLHRFLHENLPSC